MGLIEEVGSGPVCLDTAIFIYYLEENEKYLKLIEPLFKAINDGQIEAVTSGITLLELLVIPLRENNQELATVYEYLLMESKGLTTLSLDANLLRRAALLRAEWGMKTPDAFQLAAAQIGLCSTFITIDRRLPNIPGIRILQLSDYL